MLKLKVERNFFFILSIILSQKMKLEKKFLAKVYLFSKKILIFRAVWKFHVLSIKAAFTFAPIKIFFFLISKKTRPQKHFVLRYFFFFFEKCTKFTKFFWYKSSLHFNPMNFIYGRDILAADKQTKTAKTAKTGTANKKTL